MFQRGCLSTDRKLGALPRRVQTQGSVPGALPRNKVVYVSKYGARWFRSVNTEALDEHLQHMGNADGMWVVLWAHTSCLGRAVVVPQRCAMLRARELPLRTASVPGSFLFFLINLL